MTAEVDQAAGGNIASVKATLAVVGALGRFGEGDGEGGSLFADTGARATTLGPGDVLSVTVIEQVSGGLFSGSSATAVEHGANLVTLPDVQIDAQGMIALPYLGAVQAAGLTEQSLAALLADRLQSQTPNPNVMVRRTQDLSNTVLVAGAARAPGQVQLSPAGETLLEIIARAGGSVSPPSDTLVKVTRGGATRTVRLSALQDRPGLNIHLQRGDTVTLEQSPRYYTVLGAASSEASLPLPGSGLTLAEVLGQAGGLDDLRADKKGVFVLRLESRAVLKALGVTPPASATGARVPTVYQFDLGSVDGIFAAQAYPVHAKDIVLIANASGVELGKAFRLFTGAAQPVATTANIAGKL